VQRYFFHVRDGITSRDETGFECAGVDELHAEALRAAGEILRELGPQFWDHRNWTMWVEDSSGSTVLTLDFSASELKVSEAG
jgi:hypothetical protein